MEMMDVQAAVRWYGESAELMATLRKMLESHPKEEPDALKRELIATSRDMVEAHLKASGEAAEAIIHQMRLELPLLLGHPQDLAALKKAETLYAANRNTTWRLFEQTAPTDPEPRMSGIPDELRTMISNLRSKT